MNSNEAKIQLNSLIEHFKHGGLDFNATDISAIEILLDENKKYKEVINKVIKYIEENKQHEYRNGNFNEYYLELNEKGMTELLDILKEVEHE